MGVIDPDSWILLSWVAGLVVGAAGIWRGIRSLPAWLRLFLIGAWVSLANVLALGVAPWEEHYYPAGCGTPCDPIRNGAVVARGVVYFGGGALAFVILVVGAAMLLRGKGQG